MFRALINMLRGGATCKSVNAFLTDYVEGRLDEATASRFEEHVGMCPNCRRYLDQYRETVSLVKEIPAPPVPPELEARTADFLRRALRIEPESDL